MTGSESEQAVRLDRAHELRGGRKRDSMLTRGLAILSAFRNDDVELTLAELSRRAGLPKPTAHRLIAELLDAGFLERGPRGLLLGRQMFVLGGRIQRDQKIRVLAQPHLQHLRRTTGASLVYLSVAQGRDIIHLLRLGTSHLPDTRERTVALGARRALAQAMGGGYATGPASTSPQAQEAGPAPGLGHGIGLGHGPALGQGTGPGAGAGQGSDAGRGHGAAPGRAGSGQGQGQGQGQGVGPGAGAGPGRGQGHGHGAGHGSGPGQGVRVGSSPERGVAVGSENPALRALGTTGAPPAAGPVVRLEDAVHACAVLSCPVRLPGTGIVLALSAVSAAGEANRAAVARELHRAAQELGVRLAALPDFRGASAGVYGAA